MSDSTGAVIVCQECGQTDRVLFTAHQLTNLRDDHNYMVHSTSFMMSTSDCIDGYLSIICNECSHHWKHKTPVFDSLPPKVEQFPNGFNSWHETHCEISMLLQLVAQDKISNAENDVKMLEDQIGIEGSTAYYTISKRLTDEYEQLVNGFDYGQHNVMFDAAVEFFVYRRLGHQSVQREDLEKLS